MKHKIWIIVILLLTSAMTHASGYNSYSYQDAYYPANYYPASYVSFNRAPVNHNAYPARNTRMQNQYVPYGPASDQLSGYYAPGVYEARYYQPGYYQSPYAQPAYAYPNPNPNYYQPPYQGQYYMPQDNVPQENAPQEYTGTQPKNVLKQPEDVSNEVKTLTVEIETATVKVVLKDNRQRKSIDKKPAVAVKKSSQSERKKQFLKQILPLIITENEKIQSKRDKLIIIQNMLNNGQTISADSKQWANKLAKKYRVSGDIFKNSHLQEELLKRVDVIVPAMALAQAANESAWGASRFSRQGNNLFGIWTYNPDIGIKPLRREPGKKHFVRKFTSFQESVSVYMHTLNTHAAYKKLREIRYESGLKGEKLSGYDLARGLEKYSSKGQEYIKMIHLMMAKNDLEKIAAENIASN